MGPSNQKSKLTSGGRSAVQPPCPATPTQPRHGHRADSRQNARHFDVTVWREICRSGPKNFTSTRANTPLVCPREGLVEQQSLKEEIRFPIFTPCTTARPPRPVSRLLGFSGVQAPQAPTRCLRPIRVVIAPSHALGFCKFYAHIVKCHKTPPKTACFGYIGVNI